MTTITTLELISAVAPIVANPNDVTDADTKLTGRRVRHWTNEGVLRPVGGVHIGKGRSRVYDTSEIYIAAVLMLLAENQVSIEVLTHTARLLRGFASPTPLFAGVQYDRWTDAVQGSAQVFLFMGAGGRASTTEQRSSISALIPAQNLADERLAAPAGVFVDLTATFQMIRA